MLLLLLLLSDRELISSVLDVFKEGSASNDWFEAGEVDCLYVTGWILSDW